MNDNIITRHDARILNSTQLEHTKDAKRLAETKLKGLEERLDQLKAQQQWIRRWNETYMALEREKKRLFELGKQKAVMAKESSMLERYDLFEGIHGTYQKLSVVKEQSNRDKRGLSILEREADENRRKTNETEKRGQQALDLYKNATTSLLDAFDRICNASHIDGVNESIDSEADFLLDFYNKLKEESDALTSLIAEKERETDAMQKALEQLRSKRQSMEMHEGMLRHGEAVLLWLSYLEERDGRRRELQQKRSMAIKQQNDENELLGKAFAKYQDLLSQTETAEAELSMHRSYIQGQDGLALQERALRLKGRRQMLLSALSLWKRISTGFESIEEKSGKVTALRLHIQHLEDGVRQLTDEAGKAIRLAEEKEYTYMLSKGGDIIQLRSDLREGTACSVCGATHHPYHSDTILDQSKLIGQMKSDYEQLKNEANQKQQQLTDMQIELASARGSLAAMEEALNAIRIRQNEDVQEWKLYAELDPTFADCSESTNLEARTALIRQFIENVSRDAAQAEKELETFTFHQSRIAGLSEELQKLGTKKSELSVRLGELNTGLQVLSREVEQLAGRLEGINKQFTQTYENIQRTITIKDWYSLWQKTPEKLHEQIQRLLTDWSAVRADIAEREAVLAVETEHLGGMKSALQGLGRTLTLITKRRENRAGLKAENIKTIGSIVPGHDMKGLYQQNLQNVRDARGKYEAELGQMETVRHERDIMQGRHDYYLSHIQELEDEQKRLGEKLDLWMHAFNLRHPPVRVGELDELFADGKDWSQIRSNLKQINTDMLLCGAKVEDLNSRLIALDTEDGRVSTSAPDVQETIAEGMQTLGRQRSAVMMQIARLTVMLEDHERALAAQRNSAEPEGNLA